MQNALEILFAVVVVACGVLVVLLLREVATRLAALEERVTKYADALELLADTSETAFGAVARQLERVSAAPPRPARRAATTRRMNAAAKKGAALADIAAAEGISEGEARLHMHMAGEEGRHGALRS